MTKPTQPLDFDPFNETYLHKEIDSTDYYTSSPTDSEEIKQLIKQETRTRHGFRASMALAGLSLFLLATPGGLIAAPVVAGIFLLGAAAIFVYRQRIDQKLEGFRDLQLQADNEGNLIGDPVKIPSYNRKDDLIKGCLSFVPVLGALKVYYDDYRNARELREQAESDRYDFEHRREH